MQAVGYAPSALTHPTGLPPALSEGYFIIHVGGLFPCSFGCSRRFNLLGLNWPTESLWLVTPNARKNLRYLIQQVQNFTLFNRLACDTRRCDR